MLTYCGVVRNRQVGRPSPSPLLGVGHSGLCTPHCHIACMCVHSVAHYADTTTWILRAVLVTFLVTLPKPVRPIFVACVHLLLVVKASSPRCDLDVFRCAASYRRYA